MSVTVKMKKRVATRSAMEASGSTGCEASIVLSHNDHFCNFFGPEIFNFKDVQQRIPHKNWRLL